MKQSAPREAEADVLSALEETRATLAALDCRLRVLEGTLRGTSTVRARPHRRATAPTPSVEFSELDAAKADRALARLWREAIAMTKHYRRINATAAATCSAVSVGGSAGFPPDRPLQPGSRAPSEPERVSREVPALPHGPSDFARSHLPGSQRNAPARAITPPAPHGGASLALRVAAESWPG